MVTDGPGAGRPCVIGLRGIGFTYPCGRRLFSGLDFELREGDSAGLLGANGIGKTTLLRVITGLRKPDAGSVLLYGRTVETEEEWHRLRCTVGFVLQNSDDQLFSPVVLDDVAFGPLNLGMGADEAREAAMDALRSLGIEALAGRATHQLSGGERKLAAIASVLSMRPRALLLDEPTIFLDDRARSRVLEFLEDSQLPRIVVSHDMGFLSRVSNRLLTISGGRLADAEEQRV